VESTAENPFRSTSLSESPRLVSIFQADFKAWTKWLGPQGEQNLIKCPSYQEQPTAAQIKNTVELSQV
jgi:hypothetical protein